MRQSSHKGKGRDAGRSHDRPDKSKKGSRHTHPGACHCSEQPCGDGAPGCFKSTADAISALGLAVVPSPRPDESDPGFAQWLEEYHGLWRDATCPCGRGYFCQEHGRWISGSKLPNTSYRDHDHQGYSSCRDLGVHGLRDISPPPVRTTQEDQPNPFPVSAGGQSSSHGSHPNHNSATAPFYYGEDPDSSILEHYDAINPHGNDATSYLLEPSDYPTASASQWVPHTASSEYGRELDHDEVSYSADSSSSAYVSTDPYSRHVRDEDSQIFDSASYDAYGKRHDAASDYRNPDLS